MILPFPNAVHTAIDNFDFECMENANDRMRASNLMRANNLTIEDLDRAIASLQPPPDDPNGCGEFITRVLYYIFFIPRAQ